MARGKTNGSGALERIVTTLSNAQSENVLVRHVRAIFDREVRKAESFDEALVGLYEAAIKDMELTKTKRSPRKRGQPAEQQSDGE